MAALSAQLLTFRPAPDFRGITLARLGSWTGISNSLISPQSCFPPHSPTSVGAPPECHKSLPTPSVYHLCLVPAGQDRPQARLRPTASHLCPVAATLHLMVSSGVEGRAHVCTNHHISIGRLSAGGVDDRLSAQTVPGEYQVEEAGDSQAPI